MSKHKQTQFWVVLNSCGPAHYHYTVLGPWRKTFDNCELYCSFYVLSTRLLPHAVKHMVERMEELLGKEFVFKAGPVYQFTRVA